MKQYQCCLQYNSWENDQENKNKTKRLKNKLQDLLNDAGFTADQFYLKKKTIFGCYQNKQIHRKYFKPSQTISIKHIDKVKNFFKSQKALSQFQENSIDNLVKEFRFHLGKGVTDDFKLDIQLKLFKDGKFQDQYEWQWEKEQVYLIDFYVFKKKIYQCFKIPTVISEMKKNHDLVKQNQNKWKKVQHVTISFADYNEVDQIKLINKSDFDSSVHFRLEQKYSENQLINNDIEITQLPFIIIVSNNQISYIGPPGKCNIEERISNLVNNVSGQDNTLDLEEMKKNYKYYKLFLKAKFLNKINSRIQLRYTNNYIKHQHLKNQEDEDQEEEQDYIIKKKINRFIEDFYEDEDIKEEIKRFDDDITVDQSLPLINVLLFKSYEFNHKDKRQNFKYKMLFEFDISHVFKWWGIKNLNPDMSLNLNEQFRQFIKQTQYFEILRQRFISNQIDKSKFKIQLTQAQGKLQEQQLYVRIQIKDVQFDDKNLVNFLDLFDLDLSRDLINIPLPKSFDKCDCQKQLSDQEPYYWSWFNNRFYCCKCAEPIQQDYESLYKKISDTLVYVNAPRNNSNLRFIKYRRLGQNYQVKDKKSQQHPMMCNNCARGGNSIKGCRYIGLSCSLENNQDFVDFCQECFEKWRNKDSETMEKNQIYGVNEQTIWLRIVFSSGRYYLF